MFHYIKTVVEHPKNLCLDEKLDYVSHLEVSPSVHSNVLTPKLTSSEEGYIEYLKNITSTSHWRVRVLLKKYFPSFLYFAISFLSL